MREASEGCVVYGWAGGGKGVCIAVHGLGRWGMYLAELGVTMKADNKGVGLSCRRFFFFLSSFKTVFCMSLATV